MSNAILNTWTVRGNLATDVAITTVALDNGRQTKVADATLYVRGLRDRNGSFAMNLNIWEGSAAWRSLSFLKKGSPIICIGSAEPSPYISQADGMPKAGLTMDVIDVDVKSWLDDRYPSQRAAYNIVA
ncbi:single stranded DNA-binding domain-containing protein [Leptothoe spongobia]|uniref:Single-stranded DNA-binding protein n=1 Tax=Leptothoe spongobia TAU-MAC 1115 TaxID=1967444 RepID=A0A947DDR0_9CYAN|nr:single-stranded DNA-binding protein [Leptothoe spongobia]MBT9315106.1 single-stranded DNA-binding protein [Leptothoe spongobia TAU-MAC 1115]